MDKPLRVLIVEDEILLAMQVEGLLEDIGHHAVGYAADAVDAFALAEAHKPDLALVDIQLRDGLTGTEVMQVFTHDLGVPGVFLTANRRLVPKNYAGAMGVIDKPFSEHAFRKAFNYLRRLIHGQSLPIHTPPILDISPTAAEALRNRKRYA